MTGPVAELEVYRSGARALAARILSAQEAERVRVSRELHDDTGQALTLLLIRLQLIQGMTTDPTVRHELDELRALVVDTLDGVRNLATHLGPSVLEDLGLPAALEWLVDRVRADAGLHVWLGVSCGDEGIPPTVAIAVFRVAQEALTNIVRHANATSAEVDLRRSNGHLELTVSDDGAGFDVAAARARPAASIGLFGMAERVALVDGTIDVISRIGAGTRIDIRVPLREEVLT